MKTSKFAGDLFASEQNITSSCPILVLVSLCSSFPVSSQLREPLPTTNQCSVLTFTTRKDVKPDRGNKNETSITAKKYNFFGK